MASDFASQIAQFKRSAVETQSWGSQKLIKQDTLIEQSLIALSISCFQTLE